jgi:hypothetical protein
MTHDVGSIKMRMPNNKSSAITVSRHKNGSVGIHMSRTAEGEALLILPPPIAKQLAELIWKAARMETIAIAPPEKQT